MRTEEYEVDSTEIHGVKVKVSSYKIGDRFHCHIANADPGATIARAEGATRDEALQRAQAKASERLG